MDSDKGSFCICCSAMEKIVKYLGNINKCKQFWVL